MKRLSVLDGLRAISILAVLSAHMLPLGPKVLRLNETAGAMGMSLFFSLSGFLITSNLLAGQTVYSFYIRRLTRILPLAYSYLAFVFLIVSFNPRALIGSLFFIENYDFSYLSVLNGHFWSLCVEVHFYLVIGLIVAIFGQRGLWAIIPACLAVTLIRVSQGAIISIQTHLRIDEILAGAWVALIYYRGTIKLEARTWWVAVASGLWALSSWPLANDALQYMRPYFAAAILLLTVSLAPCMLQSFLASRPARYIADISYALYVIHPVTTYGWLNEGSLFERYALKRPVSFAMTFLLSHLSTFYWESLWIAWGKKITKR
jgi:peptidoglycan/LPS O-acetylase OafA/YrhL